jgi:hypothetical protein
MNQQLQPPHLVAYEGDLNALELSLRRAQNAVNGQSEIIKSEIVSSLSRIHKLSCLMTENVPTSRSTQQFGGTHHYDQGEYIAGPFSVSFINHSWADSGGSGSDPTTFIISDGITQISFEDYGGDSPIMLKKNGATVLGHKDTIDGSKGLSNLGKYNETLKWLVKLCEDVVSLKSV